jgi:hypothetical protein
LAAVDGCATNPLKNTKAAIAARMPTAKRIEAVRESLIGQLVAQKPKSLA